MWVGVAIGGFIFLIIILLIIFFLAVRKHQRNERNKLPLHNPMNADTTSTDSSGSGDMQLLASPRGAKTPLREGREAEAIRKEEECSMQGEDDKT
jgi:hypothetical protein